MKRVRETNEIEYIVGNILDEKHNFDYIVHQVNSTTTHSKGLANKVFLKYPLANNYAPTNSNVVGQCAIFSNIVNLCGQRLPGPPRSQETKSERLEWFRQGLDDLASKVGRTSYVAMPIRIGCGLAGGDWESYLDIIEKWHQRNSDIRLTLVHEKLTTVLVHFYFERNHAKSVTVLIQNPTEAEIKLLEENRNALEGSEESWNVENELCNLIDKPYEQTTPKTIRGLWNHPCRTPWNIKPNGIQYQTFDYLFNYPYPIDKFYCFFVSERISERSFIE